MEVKEVNLKRFIPSEGMVLKWKERFWNHTEKKFQDSNMWSINSLPIDLNNLVGEVEEITMEQYEEETRICCFMSRRIY